MQLLDELAAVRVHARLRRPELVLDARLPRARLGNPAERYAGSKSGVYTLLTVRRVKNVSYTLYSGVKKCII